MNRFLVSCVATGCLCTLGSGVAGQISQQAYLKASNTGAEDYFGYSVSVSGDTAVVGARWEDSRSNGVDGDQFNELASKSGSAYVYVRNSGIWSQQAYLKASNTNMLDQFGGTVAVSGDTIVVGAGGEDSDAIGINGDDGNNNALESGAAYVFVRNGRTWSQQAYLKASNAGGNDGFGRSVAISGDTIVVGSYWEDSPASGINGAQGNGLTNSGAVYVFVRSGTAWTEQAYIKASTAGFGDYFGTDVALSGETLVVSAAHEDSAASGVGGDESDDSLENAGAVYVFVRDGTTWSQQAYIKASNPDEDDSFGAVAVSADTLVVATRGEDSSATGINGDESDNSAIGAGAAYVFVRNGTTWSQQAYLKASNTGTGDDFGISVGVSGDTVVVGAWDEDSAATGVNGDQSDNSVSQAGAVYKFVRDGTNWVQQAYLKNSSIGNDWFGWSVAVDGDTTIIGAPLESSWATGVNGDQSNNSFAQAGAAYAIIDEGPWSDLGCATVGTHGEPELSGTGSLVAGTTGSLELLHALGSRPSLLLLSFSGGSTPALGGTLKPAVPWNAEFLFVISGPLDSDSSLLLPWSSFSVLPPGFELFFQFLIEDPGHFSGVALSNGVKGVVP